jgi:NAD(P)H dehydrogenase (quinone)
MKYKPYMTFRIAETLPQEVLKAMYAPPKSSYPVIEPEQLTQYDGVLLGIPTRYGNFSAQWKTFWDKTGGVWQSGGYWGKYAGIFVSTGSPGGGQESTAISAMSTLAHHGFIYVPLGYKPVFAQLTNLSEVHGGSPWGAGTFAVSNFLILFNIRLVTVKILFQGADGSRQPTDLELAIAEAQGKAFYEAVAKASSA